MPEEEISVAELSEELRAASANNAAVAAAGSKIENLDYSLLQLEKSRDAKRLQIEALQREEAELVKTIEERHSARKEVLAQMEGMTVIPEEPIAQRLQEADETNRKIRLNKEILRCKREHDEEVEPAIGRLAARVREIEDLKKNALKEAGSDIEGLGFDEKGLLLNGRPLKDASGAEIVSLALSLGFRKMGPLKVVTVDEGGSLDRKTRAMIAKEAAERGATMIMTIVANMEEDGSMDQPADFYIHDGTNYVPPKSKQNGN